MPSKQHVAQSFKPGDWLKTDLDFFYCIVRDLGHRYFEVMIFAHTFEFVGISVRYCGADRWVWLATDQEILACLAAV